MSKSKSELKPESKPKKPESSRINLSPVAEVDKA